MFFDSSESDPSHLFITDIPSNATISEILRAFERFGRVSGFSFSSSTISPHFRCGFLQFLDPTSGSLCLDRYRRSSRDPNVSPIEVRGSPLTVVLQSAKDTFLHKSSKDVRNLHLTKEGLQIDFLPSEELQKRNRILEQKQELLDDPRYRVSECRLIVSNLPPKFPTSEIRKIFITAALKWMNLNGREEGQPRIRAVMERPGREDAVMIEFSQHIHALAALREISGNSEYFWNRGVVVEFAVERGVGEMKKSLEKIRGKGMAKFAEREPPLRELVD